MMEESFNSRMLRELSELDAKLRIVLPAEYQAHYEDVQPISMGSAGLKFDAEGRVEWDRIWGSFCDLAMAGGPPHKGKLLEPGEAAAIAAEPERHGQVVAELRRGIEMVTGLKTEESPNVGWVRVECPTRVMAGWLARAIVMENVWAHVDGCTLELPAGPHFRMEKEIKNVITATAKTHHYFDGHMEASQRGQIEELFAQELLQPCRLVVGGCPMEELEQARGAAAERVAGATGLAVSGATSSWLGLACPSVRAAIWMMRALVVHNVMTRREEQTLYVPIHPGMDPRGDRLAEAVTRVFLLAKFKGLLATGF